MTKGNSGNEKKNNNITELTQKISKNVLICVKLTFLAYQVPIIYPLRPEAFDSISFKTLVTRANRSHFDFIID